MKRNLLQSSIPMPCKKLLLTLMGLFALFSGYATTYTALGGNWANAGSWTGGVPSGLATDVITIPTGITITVPTGTTATTLGSITINGSGILTIAGTLNVANITINNTAAVTVGSSGSTGVINITSGGTWSFNSSTAVIWGSGGGAGTANFGTGTIITGTQPSIFDSLTINTASTTDTVFLQASSATLIKNGSSNPVLTLKRGIFKIGVGHTLFLSGTCTINNPGATGTSNLATTGTNGANGGTVSIIGASTTTINGPGATTFYDLTGVGATFNIASTAAGDVYINDTVRVGKPSAAAFGVVIATNPPIYNANSTLYIDYSNATYPAGRGTEWSATTGTVGTTPGYPNNVIITNLSTTGYGWTPLTTNWSIGGTLTIGVVNGVAGNTTAGTATTGQVDFSACKGFFCGGFVLNANSRFAAPISGTMTVKGSWTDNQVVNGSATPPVGFINNSGTITFAGSGTCSSPNTITAPTTNSEFFNLTDSSSSGYVSLSSPVTVSNILNLKSGIITTTSSNLLSLTDTVITSITGGGASSFINGPVKWALLSSGTNSYVFPVGASTCPSTNTYLPFTLSSKNTIVSNTATVQAFSGAPSGGSGLANGTTTEYWSLSTSSGLGTTGSTVSLTRPSAIAAGSVIGKSSTLGGTYTSIGGTVSGSSINVSNDIGTTSPWFFVIGTFNPVVAIATNGTQSAGNLPIDSTKKVIYSFTAAPTVANATLTGFNFTTTGTITSSDITQYQLWYNPGINNFTDAGTVPIGSVSGIGNATATPFVSFTTKTITNGATGYFWITVDITPLAIAGHTVTVSALNSGGSNFTIASATYTAGTITAGGLQTITAPASSSSDYFRSMATGNWGTPATWQSSSDSVTWISATLAPGTGSKVLVQSGNTVTLDVAAVTPLRVTVASGGILSLSNNLAPTGGTFINGTLNCVTNKLTGAGTFFLANSSSAKLQIGDANGITTGTGTTSAGSIQTTGNSRSYPASANYEYKGSVNQAVGNGLPTTISGGGALIVTNTGTSPNNIVTLASTSSIQNVTLTSGKLSLNGLTVTVTNGTILNNGGNLATTGTGIGIPAIAGADGGTFKINGATITGPTTFYNLTCPDGSTNSTITTTGANAPLINDTLIIGATPGRFTGSNSPRYASGSTLYYNGANNRDLEWNADLTTTPTIGVTQGYPYNVSIHSGSDFYIVDSAAGGLGSTPRGLAGNLTVSEFTMYDYNPYNISHNSALIETGTFKVGGNMTINTGGNINMAPTSAGGTFTIVGSLTINGSTLSMNSMTALFAVGNGLTLAGGTINMGGSSNIGVTGNLALNSGIINAGGNLSSTGNWTNSGATFNCGTGTVTFNGTTGNQTITNTSGEKFSTLTVTKTTSGNLILANNVTTTNINISSVPIVQVGTNILTISGTISASAAGINATSGTIVMAGSSAQTIGGSMFTSATIKNLSDSNTNASGLIINNSTADSLNITGQLGFPFATAKLTTNGILSLVSNATGTALVGQSGSATITGNVIVQRYFDSHRRWRFITAPISATGAPNINAAWQEGQVSTSSTNPDKNIYGTHITGLNGVANTAQGFDVSPRNNASMAWVQDTVTTTATWNEVTSTIGTLVTAKLGWMLFVRGARDYSISTTTQYTTATNATLRTTGKLNQGTQIIATASSGFTVVGNPFASTINFSSIYSHSSGAFTTQTFYVWDPNIASNANIASGTGGWVTMNWNSGTSTYTAVPTPINSLSNAINGDIQSGTAFLVHGTGTSMTITEADKVTGSGTNGDISLFRPATSSDDLSSLRTTLVTANTDGSIYYVADGILNEFGSEYTNDVNWNKDVQKIPNTGEYCSIIKNNQYISIQKSAPVNAGDTIHLSLARLQGLPYRFDFVATSFNRPDILASLVDKYKNTSTPIHLGDSSTSASFTVDGNAASKAADRFYIVFRPAPGSVKYSNVTATQQNKNVLVQWAVSDQLNIKEYVVEKSTDGVNFYPVDTTIAAPNNTNMAYNWVDINPGIGSYYYRIRNVNNDGASQESNTVSVTIGKGILSGIAIYPNPVVNGAIGLQMNNIPIGEYGIKVMDVSGQVLLTETINHSTTSETQNIFLSNGTAKGLYILEVQLPDNTQTKIKFVNQ
jgi:hypothetical protein